MSENKIPQSEITRVKGLGFLWDKRTADRFNGRVITRNGKITAEECAVVAEAAKKFGSGEIAIYDIGQPADLVPQNQNACLIGSVVTDNAGMLKLAMQDVEAGTFGNKTIYGSFENKCLSVGTFNDELVSAEMQTAYMGFIDQMSAGTFPG